MAGQFDAVLNTHLEQVTGLPDWDYKATLTVGTHQITAHRVVALTNRQGYLDGMFEETLISISISPGQYSEIVMHGHEDMSLTLVKQTISGASSQQRIYRAVLTQHRDVKLEGNVQGVDQINDVDKVNISTITLQLIDPAAYHLRLQEVGGIFKNCTAMDVLKYLFGTLRLYDEFSKSVAVASISADTNFIPKVYGSIKIPEGTKVQELPDYLQDNYGLFSQGLGCYLKNNCWYVFAPYSLVKAQVDTDKLVILNAPPSKYRNLKRNFKLEGKTITVIATGETKHQRRSDKEALNDGTGVRYADATQLLSGMSDLSNSPMLTPDKYMTEYRSSQYKNAYNHTPMAPERFVTNPTAHSSALAARGGDYVTVTWERGDIELLTPGMPVRFLTPNGEKIRTMTGTLIGAEAFSTVPTGGMVETRHVMNVKLTLFLKDLV